MLLRFLLALVAVCVLLITMLTAGLPALAMLTVSMASGAQGGSNGPLPTSTGAVVGGYTHPLGAGSWIWNSYPGGSHLLGGVDLPAPAGTPVYAAADGVVVEADWQGTYGLAVTIRHADGNGSQYAHLSQVVVTAGSQVRAGQQIGMVGSTGKSTGPHLHFEIRAGSTSWNAITKTASWMAAAGIPLGRCWDDETGTSYCSLG